ncbi:putative quinol monooxygenase [Propionivibrio sp.]|uniref:putative quinol monooxygenase n=1 Tax=Propionivibrio sp. TaxID=2212460 RepID=UPI002611D4DB|nr:putative quinol monooxygenase [Propionivibrio sp.]
MVKIMARISAKVGTADQLQEVLKALVRSTRNEPGCVSYELFQDEENFLEFVTIEHWANNQAAEAHMTTPHVAEAFAKAAGLLAKPPSINRFTQII